MGGGRALGALTMATVVHHARPTGWVHRAWWSLLLFVPSFAASFLVGEAVT